MAELPSADELARKILAIFNETTVAWHAMPKGVFLAQSRNVGLAFNDVGRASKAQLASVVDWAGTVRLTELGFKEM